MRMLSLNIPPQGTSIGQGWLESTPYTSYVSRTYLDFLPPPFRGWWGVLAAPNSALLLPMVRNKPSHKVDSALRAI